MNGNGQETKCVQGTTRGDNEAFKYKYNKLIEYVRSISNETKPVYCTWATKPHTQYTENYILSTFTYIAQWCVHERPPIQNVSFGVPFCVAFSLDFSIWTHLYFKMMCVYHQYCVHRAQTRHICIVKIYDAIIAPQFPINPINWIRDEVWIS